MTPEKLQMALQGCAAKHEPSLKIAYDATSAHLYGLAMRILKNEAQAQDCLQAAWIKIWDKAHQYDPSKASAITWLSTIVRNQALDLLRRKRNETSLDQEEWASIEDEGLSQEAQAEQTQEAEAVHRCLESLEADQRRSIELAYFEGLSHRELAEKLDRPLGTVKSWVLRGLKRLKLCLTD